MLNSTKSATMITIFSCMGQGEKHYTSISIDNIIKLLERFHGIQVKRRWIFYCIKELLDLGLLTRKARHVQDYNGIISQLSSLISVTLKGAKYLVSKRVSGAFRLWKKILSFIRSKDKRWPEKKDVSDGSFWPEAVDEKERLKGLLENVTKEV